DGGIQVSGTRPTGHVLAVGSASYFPLPVSKRTVRALHTVRGNRFLRAERVAQTGEKQQAGERRRTRTRHQRGTDTEIASLLRRKLQAVRRGIRGGRF